MYDLLSDLRIVEGASFIAAPSCGMHLAQLGAEVIRFDQIGGGPDYNRWPLNSRGASLYWEGLNKGKKSIALDLRSPEGRELALRLATAPGPGAGIFLTNYPAKGFLAHENLARLRADQITLRVMGWPDGTGAVDYTVNPAVGLPTMTGHPDDPRPVNHVLPAWDLLTGSMAATSLLAAERRRARKGTGEEIRLSLSDVAIASLGHLGQLAEAVTQGDRPRSGNDLFGAFGRDFATADGQRIMVVALTPRQWSGLVASLDLAAPVAALEARLGISFARDEGLRWQHRDTLNAMVGTAIAARSLAELRPTLDRENVCWSPYQSLSEAVTNDPRLVRENPLFSALHHPSGEVYPAPGAAADHRSQTRQPLRAAPVLGADTEQVLAEVLGCTQSEIARLHDRGIVASGNRRAA